MVPEPVIEFDDVCFAYEREEVLHNVTLQILNRDMVALVGPNGGGKTTLLRLALGFLKPKFGAVRVFGAAPDAVRRRIGYVPQHVLFDPQFPVNALDVVKMGRVDRRRAGPYRRSDGEAALQALEKVDMAELRRRPFAELSGGERQRVLIAQALVSGPDLLLMDEPTANVDYVVEHRLYDLLRALNERLTVVIVSHNLNVITGHVTRVVCVNRTAEIHAASEVTATVFREAHGGDMALLKHDVRCHVIDPYTAMHSPHKAQDAEGVETGPGP